MPEEYLTDDEQLEHVKHLAADYGPWMIGSIVIGMLFVFGYRYYDNHQNQRAMQASMQFGEMTSALQRDEPAKARQIAEDLIKDYPTSPYADQAKLTLARLYLDAGQAANAIAPLTDVTDTAKDAELRHIARLRLARVLIDQGKPDDALKALADAPGEFSARYHEVRGDAFNAKKDFPQALTEYKAALGEGPANTMDSAMLALKIADLGLPAPPPATAAATPTAPTNKAKP